MFYLDDLYGEKILKSDRVSGITAFFTTRKSEKDVINCIKAQTGARIVTPVQTHSDHVEVVDNRDEYPDTDALILDKADTVVYLRFADCTPLIFYDPVKNIAAISHAGWRGTASKIGVKTVEKMHSMFNSEPKDIVVLIGPAISLCCYEVSEDIKNALLSTVKTKDGLYNNRNVDLKGINAQQLKEAGIQKIDICPYCTSCNNDLFYSYRKENGTKERHFAVIKL